MYKLSKTMSSYRHFTFINNIIWKHSLIIKKQLLIMFHEFIDVYQSNIDDL